MAKETTSSPTSIHKTVSCPPDLRAVHISRWGLAKLHAKQRFIDAAEKLSSRRLGYRPDASVSMKFADGKPVALVGPVIGLVTSTSARILLEVDRQATVEMTLHKQDEDAKDYVFRFSKRILRLFSTPAWLHVSKTKQASPAESRTEHVGSIESSVSSHEDVSNRSREESTSSKQQGSKMSPRSTIQRASSPLRLWRKRSAGSLQRHSPLGRMVVRNGETEIDAASADSVHSPSFGTRSEERTQLKSSTVSFGSPAIASPGERSERQNDCTHDASSSMATTGERNQATGMSRLRESSRRRGSRTFGKLWRGWSLRTCRLGRQQRTRYLSHGAGKEEIVVSVVKGMEARRPSVFVFRGLEPQSRYRVEVKGCQNVEKSSFKTFPTELSQRFCMASISCNSIFITRKTITSIDDLWNHLQKSIEANQIDLLIHLGDQIYGDGDRRLDAAAGKKNRDRWSNRFERALHMLNGLPKEEWALKKEEICEKYREVYRDTWKHPSTAHCLAHCPNLMIYDDHEIRDNWGDNPLDCQKDRKEHFVARCAWTVTLEYQRQLFEDVDFLNIGVIQKDYYFHVIDKIGLMFLDIRGSRTFHRMESDATPYLGSRQWKDIDQALGVDGVFQNVRVLAVCSPAPLVFLVPSVTVVAPTFFDRLEDFKGHWSAYKQEQKKMIDTLRQWKESRKGREVIILGGDVHCGGHSCIMDSGETLFYQLTTSPIANMPLPKTVYYCMRFAEQFENIQGFKVHHFSWTRARNYGLVHVDFRGEDENEVPEVTTELARAKFLQPVRMGRKVSNLETYTSKVCSLRSPWQWCQSKMFIWPSQHVNRISLPVA